MPKERKKVLCMDAQRHAEYYGMQQTFDELYAKSKAGEVFNGLMELVLSRFAASTSEGAAAGGTASAEGASPV